MVVKQGSLPYSSRRVERAEGTPLSVARTCMNVAIMRERVESGARLMSIVREAWLLVCCGVGGVCVWRSVCVGVTVVVVVCVWGRERLAGWRAEDV